MLKEMQRLIDEISSKVAEIRKNIRIIFVVVVAFVFFCLFIATMLIVTK